MQPALWMPTSMEKLLDEFTQYEFVGRLAVPVHRPARLAPVVNCHQVTAGDVGLGQLIQVVRGQLDDAQDLVASDDVACASFAATWLRSAAINASPG